MINKNLPELKDLPQEVKDKLIAVVKQKLPDADDQVINDIISEHMSIVREYALTLYAS